MTETTIGTEARTETRNEPKAEHRIVVGVDGSEGARAALEFALAEAALRGVSVEAVTAWSLPVVSDGFGGVYPLPEQYTRAEADARALVAAELAAVQPRYPSVVVTTSVLSGQAADALIAASKGADLLVVGSRGRGGFAALLLGSVTQQLSHHAPCPLVIIPHAR